jgi:hypothetical protein
MVTTIFRKSRFTSWKPQQKLKDEINTFPLISISFVAKIRRSQIQQESTKNTSTLYYILMVNYIEIGYDNFKIIDD